MTPTQIKMAVTAAVFIGWSAAVAWTATSYERRAWEASTERLKAEAATTLANAEKATREAEKRARDAATKADGAYLAAQDEINRTRSDFDRRLDERLRDARRRCSGGNVLPGTATAPSGTQDPPGSRDSGPGGPDPASIRKLRDYALTLQAYAKTCNSWVTGAP